MLLVVVDVLVSSVNVALFVSVVQLCSLKTETERIQAQKEQLQADLLSSCTELEALRVALSHVQNNNKALSSDKVNAGFGLDLLM